MDPNTVIDPLAPSTPAQQTVADVLATAKNEDRTISARVLQSALDVVMNQRKNQHGDAESSFTMIADLWGVFMKHRGQNMSPGDVAFMMVLLKIARAVYGNGSNADHYVDGAGYLSLAAMINKANI